jgi:hypothetical protein
MYLVWGIDSGIIFHTMTPTMTVKQKIIMDNKIWYVIMFDTMLMVRWVHL